MALSSRTRSARGLVVLLVAISLVTITIDSREGEDGPLARLGSVALAIITPLQEGVSKVTRPIGNFFSAVGRLPSLEEENERLRAAVQESESIRIQNGVLAREAAELAELLDMCATLFPNMSTTGARVIGNGVYNLEWSITIDKGSNDGIAVDMPVVSSKALVGRVNKVTPWSASVELLRDPSARVAVQLTASEQQGLLQGRGDRNPEVTLVPPTVEVEVGEPVVTTSYQVDDEHGLYPAGIPIGSVTDVTQNAGVPDITITVEPYVDFSSLEFVLVVMTEVDE